MAENLTWLEVKAWRKGERERLIGERLAMPAETRAELTGRMVHHLDEVIGKVEGRVASFYWPFRGEPDLRPWAARVVANGGATALPVVVEKGRPLIFRAWTLGDKLERGVWNIPVPAAGEEVLPDIVIAPLVGWDETSTGSAMAAAFSTAHWKLCATRTRSSSASAMPPCGLPPSIPSRTTFPCRQS